MLARFIKHLIAADNKPTAASHDQVVLDTRPRVLNVGGGSKTIPIPSYYSGWNHLLLDIDSRGGPDVLCDARELESLEGNQFDAIYCSHNLEHYYKHDGYDVLRGFLHVLKPNGFADIRVPDVGAVMRAFVQKNMDIEDILYVSAAGPISVRDVLYGWSVEIESSGEDFYAHKTGFTPNSLNACLAQAGFPIVMTAAFEEAFEVRAVAFKDKPTAAQREMLGLPADEN